MIQDTNKFEMEEMEMEWRSFYYSDEYQKELKQLRKEREEREQNYIPKLGSIKLPK